MSSCILTTCRQDTCYGKHIVDKASQLTTVFPPETMHFIEGILFRYVLDEMTMVGILNDI